MIRHIETKYRYRLDVPPSPSAWDGSLQLIDNSFVIGALLINLARSLLPPLASSTFAACIFGLMERKADSGCG